jgi:NitT/TauT family transport system substrate-binding protein
MPLLSACTDKQESGSFKATTSIAVSETPLSAPVFVAAKMGYFRKHGLDVTLERYNGGHKCLKAVLDGNTEYGTSSDYPIMINSFKRSDYEVLATFVSSDNDVKLMADRRKNITYPSDIKGKRIGVVSGGSSHYFLDRFLLFNNMKLDDVEIQHTSPEKMPAAITAGEVDAIAVLEPYAYLAREKLGDNLISFPAKDYYCETFNLVGLKKTVKENGDVAIRIIKALKEAEDFIESSPEQAQQIVIDELKIDQKFIRSIWSDFDFRLSLEQSLLLTLENEARWAIENKIVDEKFSPNFLGYINPAPINAAGVADAMR